ncbi:NAD(P)H-hydrate dehydratase [Paenibacillus sp. HJL G12]|uniref:Bifunctional NAD(P)H-hydrate repair enzyme n=1 Tax=Paenibacillus dendrobii TaxID=2691084 RepID=A0A7X3ILU8_9BACL|nr:NAD(P)H-hydrate dehydratase [Paenibacillus dendrobii]MWV45806.1 NAD(P)H-hydrate dehydratase [Paenibacillus dendrobii]
MYMVTSAQMRELDRRTIEEIGIPSAALMENAGRAIAEEVIRLCRERNMSRQVDEARGSFLERELRGSIRGDEALELEQPGREHWLILAGKGNNGGDGLVAARYLREAGVGVTVVYALPPEQLQGDGALQRDAAARLGIPLLVHGRDAVDYAACTGIVDALLGTGAHGEPRGAYADMIAAANASGRMIVSADIPSGVDADTGEVSQPCIAARLTVCLAFLKRGLTQYPGAEAAGEVVVRSIGIPSELCGQQEGLAYLLTEGTLRGRLRVDAARRRSPDGHKGTYGHVLVAAGSPRMSGAGLLCSRAALRAGSGLVTWALPAPLLPHMAGAAPEIMLAPAAEGDWDAASATSVLQLAESRDVIAIGPGLGRFEKDGEWLRRIWEQSQCPLVVDADALNMLADRTDLSAWKTRRADTVLTPHPGEMARLAGLSTKEIQRDRIGAAVKYATVNRVTLVLKGARTIIAAPDGSAYVNMTGNAGMATGGSGDVLTGIIAGLLAQGLTGLQAAAYGVYLHGLAGETAAARRGHMSSLIAGDLIEAL